MKTTGQLETATDKTLENLYEQSEWLEDKNDQTKTEDHVETVTETEEDESKYLNTEEKSIENVESIWFFNPNWTGAFARCFFLRNEVCLF
jgi:hypothetical protein